MNLANTFIDWERHAVARDCWVEDDVWHGKFPVHAVKGFDELQNKRQYYGILKTFWRSTDMIMPGP